FSSGRRHTRFSRDWSSDVCSSDLADEVRALAARTQESTKDIQLRIERLQEGVSRAVQAMHAGSGKARDSVERATGVDQALSDTRSEERRVGEEDRARWSSQH